MWAAPQDGTNTTDCHLVWISVGRKGWAWRSSNARSRRGITRDVVADQPPASATGCGTTSDWHPRRVDALLAVGSARTIESKGCFTSLSQGPR